MITNGNDVFGPCAASIFICSIVGVEALLRGKLDDPKQDASLIKRVSVWSDVLAHDIIPDIVKGHQLAGFEKRALKNRVRYGNGRINLHISLLLHASKEMIKLCKHGLGKSTGACVKTWFCLMKRTKESELFRRASAELREELCNVCNNFARKFHDIQDGMERPFFHPSLLFVRVALMVWFLTKSNNTEYTIPNMKELQEPLSEDSGDMTLWEHLSGKLVSDFLQADLHGLNLLKDNREDDQKPSFFEIIHLPYQLVKSNLDDSRSIVKVPSVIHAHDKVMVRLSEVVSKEISGLSSITEWEYGEVSKWEDLARRAMKANRKKVNDKTLNCEKARNHYYKRRDFNNPRHPTRFLRNAFLLGECSFHQRFVENAAPWAARPGRSTTSSLAKTKFPPIVEMCERGWKSEGHV